jgi:hypothetical protein
MKYGAIAILLVPGDFSRIETYEDPTIISPRERAKHFMQYDHKRLYGTDFPQRLEKVGFVISDRNFLDEIAEEVRIHYALPKSELMFGYMKKF